MVEDFKITNFKKDHPRVDYPKYIGIDNNQMLSLLECFRKKFHLEKDDINGFLFYGKWQDSQIRSVNADNDNFDLKAVFHIEEIEPCEEVYVWWTGLNQTVDLFKLGSLIQYWSDIWYPCIDDIILFDNSFEWLIGVDHHGNIYLRQKK